MQRKLLLTYMVIIAITVLATVLFSWNKVNEHFFNQVETESKVQTILLRKIIEIQSVDPDFDFQEFAVQYGDTTELRITIIDSEGVVYADSSNDPAEMENHKYRTEFQAALEGRTETSLRYSSTMAMYLFYYATPLNLDSFQGALRISVPVHSIETLIKDMIMSIIIGLSIGVMMSVIMAYLFTRRIMIPINELTVTAKKISAGDLDNKVYIHNKDQIGEMADAFNTMTYTMRKNLWVIEHKNAELESILSSMELGLAAIDENYQFILCNEPFKKILGITDVLEGKKFFEVSRNPYLFTVIERSIEQDEFIVEETKIANGDDEKIIRISAVPIKSKNPKTLPIGILLIIENITKLRKLENLRSDFVSNVTHELKTPLTSIRGFVETLRQGAIHDETVALRFLDIIDIESERLTRLIEDILSLSEIENIKLDKNIALYELQDIVEDVVEILKPKAIEKDLEIKVEISPEMKPFKCNHDRIKQLLINLIENSIKYTLEGQVNINVRMSRDNANVRIVIKDTGIGIAEEHMERLFERFYRVDKGRSRNMGGTGLGLSIVKHIVELYKGEISVSSALGEGTKMTITLPYE